MAVNKERLNPQQIRSFTCCLALHLLAGMLKQFCPIWSIVSHPSRYPHQPPWFLLPKTPGLLYDPSTERFTLTQQSPVGSWLQDWGQNIIGWVLFIGQFDTVHIYRVWLYFKMKATHTNCKLYWYGHKDQRGGWHERWAHKLHSNRCSRAQSLCI